MLEKISLLMLVEMSPLISWKLALRNGQQFQLIVETWFGMRFEMRFEKMRFEMKSFVVGRLVGRRKKFVWKWIEFVWTIQRNQRFLCSSSE